MDAERARPPLALHRRHDNGIYNYAGVISAEKQFFTNCQSLRAMVHRKT